jgi:predicted RNA-binding protein with PIN domain
MPILVDGNNLLYAVADALGHQISRYALADMLARFARHRRQSVRVVFDGAPASDYDADQFHMLEGVAVTFSYPGPADRVVIDDLNADSAPRSLRVVSTDRQIRRAARRRKARSVRSEHFAGELLAGQDPPEPPTPPEPPEKRKGLTEDQTRKWLKEFGYE